MRIDAEKDKGLNANVWFNGELMPHGSVLLADDHTGFIRYFKKGDNGDWIKNNNKDGLEVFEAHGKVVIEIVA